MTSRPVVVQNPILVPANNHEVAWERTIDVLHDYSFEIERENKLGGVIETKYIVGSSLFEPWHREAVGFDNRLEGTLQSIRRRAFVTLTPTEDGYLVGVEVFKEIEDVQRTLQNSAGAATFQESTPLQRDLNLIVDETTPAGWIPRGRDSALEQSLLRRLQTAFSR